jgi:methyltransferase
MAIVYYLFVFVYIVQRLLELRRSDLNRRQLAQMGYVDNEPPNQFKAMFLVHIFWFLGLIFEPHFNGFRPSVPFAYLCLALFLSAQYLRLAVLQTLGVYWNVGVMRPASSQSEATFVSAGPYRRIRHPNYLAVIIEIATLPLINGAWITALVCSLLNAIVLIRRVRYEEKELFKDPAYAVVMGPKARFIPGLL